MIKKYFIALLLATNSIAASEGPKHLEAYDLVSPKVCTLFRSNNKQIDSFFNSGFITHIITEYLGLRYKAYFTHPEVRARIAIRVRPFFSCKDDTGEYNHKIWQKISKTILDYYGHDYTKDASHEFYCEANYSPVTGFSIYSIDLLSYYRIESTCLTDNYRPLAVAIFPKKTYISGLALTALYTSPQGNLPELRLLELNFRTGTIMSEKILANSTTKNKYTKFLTGTPHGLKVSAAGKLHLISEK